MHNLRTVVDAGGEDVVGPVQADVDGEQEADQDLGAGEGTRLAQGSAGGRV